MKRFALPFMVLALAACKENSAPNAGGAKPSITIWWAQWAPADGLQQLGNDFEKETGIAVKVHQIPWPDYQNKVNQEFGRNQTSFDIVVGDSQWIGRGVQKKLYVELTDWIKTAVDMNTVHPRAARYLCEYPLGSGRFYAAPCETDAMGIAYRKDWFEDPKEKEAFRRKYGRELAPPQTWDELKDIAEFFHRPEQKRYGFALLTGRSYDALTMGFEQILFAFGGSWGDEKTYKVDGHINSEGAVMALEFTRQIIKFGPPGSENLDYGQVMEPLYNGSTAMCANYFAFFPEVVNKLGDKAGFCPMPTQGGKRFVTLGGQGFSISTKIPAAQQELAKKFIAWFLRKDIQLKWITKPAGFTANTAILNSDEFRKATPYNRAFAESLDHLVDFWNVPVYGELLAVVQKYVGEALDGVRPSKEALDKIAEEHEKIFQKARDAKELPQ